MVAITVILAAVIGTFVLGLGDKVSQSAPQASISGEDAENTFSSDITQGGSAADIIVLNHGGGDTLEKSQTEIKVSNSDGTASVWGGTDPVLTGSVGANNDDEAVISLASSPSSFSTADAITLQIELNEAGSGDTGTTYNPTGEYTVNIVDKPSGQIIAEKNVDVS